MGALRLRGQNLPQRGADAVALRVPSALAVLTAIALVGTPLRAQTASPYRVDPLADSLVSGGALLGLFLSSLIPVDVALPPEGSGADIDPTLPFDMPTRERFSATASSMSDAGWLLSTATPLVAFIAQGANGQTGQATLVYGEAVLVNLFVNGVTKNVVARPRPYVYNPNPKVRAWASRQGRDAFRSFYSGHASSSFTSAIAGATLFAIGSDDRAARAVLFGVGTMTASATAVLRVRAGRHYPSDVVIGALIGSGVGFGAAILHARDPEKLRFSWQEGVGLGSGLLLGTLTAMFYPLAANIDAPLDDAGSMFGISPLALPHGGGLALSGSF